MQTIASILGLPLTGYGAGVACALLLFWCAAGLWLRGRKVSYAKFCCFALCTALFGWLVSRVVFALCSIPTYINEYENYFAPAFMFWDGGYAMTGMLAGVALGAAVSGKLTGTRAGTMLNAAGFGLPLGVAVLRLTEFLVDTAESGDIGEGDYIAEGALSELLARFGLLMKADGDFCYPISLLGCAVAVIVFVVILVWLARRRWEAIPGDVMLVALLLICAVQVLLEPMRDDGHLTFHFVPFQQVLALVIVIAALGVWLHRYQSACRNKRLPLVVRIIAVVCIIVGVIASFMIDRYENKVIAWGLLILPMVVLTVTALYTRAATNYITGE